MNHQPEPPPASERMMRIVMTDDPTGHKALVHVHFLPTHLPAPGTSAGWIYRLLVRATRSTSVPRSHYHDMQTGRGAARTVLELAREQLGRRITERESETLTYHRNRFERFIRNRWREHIMCTEDEAASVCDVLLQHGIVNSLHHSAAEWDRGCRAVLQDDVLPPSRMEVVQLIMHIKSDARKEKLLSLRLRSIGLAQIDRAWCYSEWPVGGRYNGGTTPETTFISGTARFPDDLSFWLQLLNSNQISIWN